VLEKAKMWERTDHLQKRMRRKHGTTNKHVWAFGGTVLYLHFGKKLCNNAFIFKYVELYTQIHEFCYIQSLK
jgi:hypothetical protein